MELKKLEDIFKVLGNESRLKILSLLLKKNYCGEELAQMLNLSSATISHHMKKLEDAGLVIARKEQYYTYYFVNDQILSELNLSEVLKTQGLRDEEVDKWHSEYQQKIIKDFFDSQGKLKSIPSQRKKREVILQKIVEAFEPNRRYSEQEVNLILARFHDDFCTLRRELIGYKLMERKDGHYWRVITEINRSKEEFTLEDLIRVMKAERDKLKPDEKVKKIASYHRIQNSPGIDAAINEMANELSKYGITTQIKCFKSDDRTFYQDYLAPGGWLAHKGQLRLKETGEVLADYEINPIQLIQRSCSTDGKEELEVYVVDDLEQVLKEKPDLTGKILLTDQNVHKIKDLVHDPLGARGIIFDGMRPVPGRNLEEMKDARQYTSFWWSGDEKRTFGFVISPALGKRLRDQIRAGKQVKVECEVEAQFLDQPLKVLHARIPGKTDENLLMVAHICHPYPSVNDNASGAGAAVEVMQFLNRMIQEKKIPRPDRGIELLLVPEFSGTFAFLDHYLETGNYLAGINLDMVGENQDKCGSTLQVVAPPISLPGLTGDLLYYILKQVTDEDKIRLKKVPFMGGSDHAILSDPTVGIPCPMLIQQPDRYYHTDQDTLDKLDPIILKDVTVATAIYLYYLANAHLAEVQEIMEIYKQGFLEMVKSQIEEVLQRAQEENLPNNVFAYCNRWVIKISDCYIQAIDYFKKYIKADEFNYFQKLNAEWQKSYQVERSKLMKEMNKALRELVKVKPELAKNMCQRNLSQLERKLTQLVPERKYWGFSTLTQKRHLVEKKRLIDLWRIIEKDNLDIPVLAQYWADGQRNLFEIMELVELETGQREVEFIYDFFRFLKDVGSIELHERRKNRRLDS